MGNESLVMRVEDAAVVLGISRGLAYDLVRRGELPSIRLGRRIVVPRRQLLEIVEAGSSRAASDRV